MEIEIVTWKTELTWKSCLHRVKKPDSLYPYLEKLTYRSTNPGALDLRTLKKIQVVLYVGRVGKQSNADIPEIMCMFKECNEAYF